ncbi:hypothetical protein O2W14_02195 [Modestobacter sp. VKM Ac-2986]|uniref:hypothetical protein n=1 Tax=Modestobacter sp. VKM Ac-2986 TaxID=3004140 RepID=UPI0022AA84F3|nr:hypothetical protein [Modestobacter sp. VKM Ac-2986]MCZ2827646.1 hypothetical protein [Modestobacter sp. VKM Ac-2986]
MRSTANTPGRRTGHVLLAGLVAAVALLLGPGTAQAAGTVTPTASCYQPNSDGSVSVLLGYVNNTGVTQTIPYGPGNVISPSRYDRAQPTSFAPGSHPGAFAVTVPASDAWGGSWTLDGVTLSNASVVGQCPAGTSLPADGNGLGMTMVMVGSGLVAAVALVVSRRRGRALPAPAA